jgi:hypothetical protein
MATRVLRRYRYRQTKPARSSLQVRWLQTRPDRIFSSEKCIRCRRKRMRYGTPSARRSVQTVWFLTFSVLGRNICLSSLYIRTRRLAAFLHFHLLTAKGRGILRAFWPDEYPDLPHATLVVGPEGSTARLLGSPDSLAVLQVGPKVELLCDPSGTTSLHSRWDRQVRAFGVQG